MLPCFYGDAVQAHLAELFPADASSPEEPTAPRAEALLPPIPLPVDLPTEVQAELAAASTERHTWITEAGRPHREATHGHYQRVADVWVSTTDPDATLMRKKEGGVHPGYHTHYVVDGG
jgi:hypothetical protein